MDQNGKLFVWVQSKTILLENIKAMKLTLIFVEEVSKQTSTDSLMTDNHYIFLSL